MGSNGSGSSSEPHARGQGEQAQGNGNPKLSFARAAAATSTAGLESAMECLVFGTTVPEDVPTLVSARSGGFVICFCMVAL